MRFVPEIFQKIETRTLTGPNAVNGRVTVVPAWQLKSTPPSYGNSVRGPFRYWGNGLEEHYEVPAIESIQISRPSTQDVATCNITIYNSWHEINTADPEQTHRLGKPGYFWPKRGEGDSASTWNQEPGRGAYRKNGSWDPSFSWRNVLMEDALLFTYQGYGGRPTDGNYVSIDKNLDDNHILPTGVWLIDTVTGSANGMMQIECRDIGRLLLDQIVFPPLIPAGLYPLEYTVAGKSAFESPWGPKVKTGVSPASRGEVKVSSWTGSGDSDSTNPFKSNLAVDGQPSTYSLSEAYGSPLEVTPGGGGQPPAVFWQFGINQNVSAIKFTPWAGGYTAYISVRVGGVWQGTTNIPTSSPGRNIPYVQTIGVPQYVPDGFELPVDVNLGGSPDVLYNAEAIRITFTDLYYSTRASSAGNYRGGLRDFVCYRVGTKTNNYNTDFTAIPWTYTLEAHPTRGYWVAENDGTVHGFGDAADYDSSAFGTVPLGAHGSNNVIADMARTPSGKGYWVVDWMGHVWAYGDADHHGEYAIADPWIPFDPKTPQKARVWAIAGTHTGGGYWVVYSDGYVRGFGDASPSFFKIPDTPVSIFMEQWRKNHNKFFPVPYNAVHKATSIASHPKKMAFAVTDGSGQVWTQGDTHKGQLIERRYNDGMADAFKIGDLDRATKIEYTQTGNGYWVLFGGGQIAAFGDAVNQGPVRLYDSSTEDNVVVDNTVFDPSFFRALVYGLSRDPDGSGFWVMNAAGDVRAFNADFWGQPGYHGLTGYRWHEGNYDGTWESIVKDMLLWSGFMLKEGNTNLGPTEKPEVLGLIEGTGVKTDDHISGDKFDKKTIMDAIKEIAEVVAYDFRITEEGGAYFASSNMWRAGNFDENGQNIYVVGDSYTRCDEGDTDAQPFIPEVHEDINLLEYSVTLSSAEKRSEFIIGNEAPNPRDPSQTGFVRHVPPVAKEQVLPGVPAMRNIQRPGIWVAGLFENQEENKLMAEMIGLRAWFSQRTASTTCTGNPCISPGDQVRIIEQNTSESFIHYVSGLDTSMNLSEGSFTMSLQTHWLGDADNWVITADPNRTSDYPYVVISERVDTWQARTNRKLQDGSLGLGSGPRVNISGEFTSTTVASPSNPTWGAWMEEADSYGDASSYMILNPRMLGNGISWPFPTNGGDSGASLNEAISAAQTYGRRIILTASSLPVALQDEDGFPSSVLDYASAVASVVNQHQIGAVLVWDDLIGVDYDLEKYGELYEAITSAVSVFSWPVNVFGPNLTLAERGDGYDEDYNGVTVDSRDMEFLEEFVSTYDPDGVAIKGDFSDADWTALLSHLKSLYPKSFVVSSTSDLGADGMNEALSFADLALWPSSEELPSLSSSSDSSWEFTGTIIANDTLPSFRVTTERASDILGVDTFIEIYNGSTLIVNKRLGLVNETVPLGNLGSSSAPIVYTYKIKGLASATGNGRLKLLFSANTIESVVVEDNVIVVRS